MDWWEEMESLEIPNDDSPDDNVDILHAYREYYAGRLIVREGFYIDPFPADEDDFLDGITGEVGYYEDFTI
jgi:hypothetical protein